MLYQRIVSAARDGRIVSGLRMRVEPYYRAKLGLPLLPGYFSLWGNFTGPQASALKSAFDAARQGSHLPPAITQMEGMSGQLYRALVNRLIGSLPSVNYLEVGSWKGSTVSAALHGNGAKATCVDNWSQFDGPRDEFIANTLTLAPRLTVMDADFRDVDYRQLGRPFDVFLFDGPHTQADQYDGIVLARPALARNAVLIVDDWNWAAVRVGTFRALRDLRLSLIASIEIRTTLDDTHPEVKGRESNWHNGYFLAVVA